MSDNSIEPAIQAYVGLDLTPGSPAYQALMSRAPQEAGLRELTITTEGDSNAPSEGLTQGMLTWYQSHVAQLRTSAISTAEDLASQITLGKGTPGIVERVKVDEAKRTLARRRSEILSAFRNENATLIKDLDDTDTEHDRLRIQEGGRDAKVPNHFVEWGILLPLIMLPEALLNFESFRRAPIIQSDFQALGATIIVGIGIAIAAHLIGRFIRQFSFFMRADDERSNRAGWPLWSIGIVLLTVALGVVAYARYQYLIPLAEQAIILGRSPPNIMAQTAGLLGGNMVVFLIGVGLTFMLHDPNPEFSDKARKLKKLEDKVNGIRKVSVLAKLREIERRFTEDTEAVKRITSQMSNQHGFSALRACNNAIEGKDREVVGVLSQYKQALIDAISARQPNFTFEKYYSSGDRTADSERVKLSDYAAMNPQLMWSQK